jgi:hypothetical protein
LCTPYGALVGASEGWRHDDGAPCQIGEITKGAKGEITKSGEWTAMVAFECRGVEPIEWKPEDGSASRARLRACRHVHLTVWPNALACSFNVESDGGKVWQDCDLSEEWCESAVVRSPAGVPLDSFRPPCSQVRSAGARRVALGIRLS